MPAPLVKSFAQRTGVSPKRGEHVWQVIKKAMTDKWGHAPKTDDEWAYTVGAYKRAMQVTELEFEKEYKVKLPAEEEMEEAGEYLSGGQRRPALAIFQQEKLLDPAAYGRLNDLELERKALRKQPQTPKTKVRLRALDAEIAELERQMGTIHEDEAAGSKPIIAAVDQVMDARVGDDRSKAFEELYALVRGTRDEALVQKAEQALDDWDYDTAEGLLDQLKARHQKQEAVLPPPSWDPMEGDDPEDADEAAPSDPYSRALFRIRGAIDQGKDPIAATLLRVRNCASVPKLKGIAQAAADMMKEDPGRRDLWAQVKRDALNYAGTNEGRLNPKDVADFWPPEKAKPGVRLIVQFPQAGRSGTAEIMRARKDNTGEIIVQVHMETGSYRGGDVVYAGWDPEKKVWLAGKMEDLTDDPNLLRGASPNYEGLQEAHWRYSSEFRRFAEWITEKFPNAQQTDLERAASEWFGGGDRERLSKGAGEIFDYMSELSASGDKRAAKILGGLEKATGFSEEFTGTATLGTAGQIARTSPAQTLSSSPDKPFTCTSCGYQSDTDIPCPVCGAQLTKQERLLKELIRRVVAGESTEDVVNAALQQMGVKCLGVSGGELFVSIDDTEYGFQPKGALTVEELQAQFEQLLQTSAEQALSWLRANSSQRTGPPGGLDGVQVEIPG